jgi:selT/selW/selH-like putative selenoprotein
VLIKGRGGVFKVTVGNALIFSKQEQGRFPTESEILEKLRGLKRG